VGLGLGLGELVAVVNGIVRRSELRYCHFVLVSMMMPNRREKRIEVGLSTFNISRQLDYSPQTIDGVHRYQTFA
jgi:hypothetical protein